jgi:hypothetical protein
MAWRSIRKSYAGFEQVKSVMRRTMESGSGMMNKNA